MKLRRFLSSLLLIISLVLLCLTNAGALSFDQPYIFQLSKELPEKDSLVAFVNVNIVPMDSERILENQTVIVREGVIESVGYNDQVQIPNDALIVDGRKIFDARSGGYACPYPVRE